MQGLSFFMSSSFLLVYKTTMNTILICFIMDQKAHSDPDDAYYPRALYEVMIPLGHKEKTTKDGKADSKRGDDEDVEGGKDGDKHKKKHVHHKKSKHSHDDDDSGHKHKKKKHKHKKDGDDLQVEEF